MPHRERGRAMNETTTSGRMSLELRLDRLIDQFQNRPYQHPGLSLNESIRLRDASAGMALARLFGVLSALISPQYGRPFTKTRLFTGVSSVITGTLADETEKAKHLAGSRPPVHAISIETGTRTPRCDALAGPTGLSADVSCAACLALIDKKLAAPNDGDATQQDGGDH